MKFLRSFDTYLLERYPILWHSKVVYLVLAGILFWIAAFITGYALTDIPMLQHEDVEDYYFDSYFASLHAILVIILICIWAIYYFKKNAIRHYYPLARLYFTRLFLCLLIGFILPLSAYTPFTYGVRKKTLSLIDGEQLEKDRRTINLAAVFLPTYQSYDLTDRVYPQPFPADLITYDENNEAWDRVYHIADSSSDSSLVYPAYAPESHPENTVVIDGRNYQFFYLTMVGEMECYSSGQEIITAFVHPDSSLNLHDHSILNYSEVEIPGFMKRYQRPVFGRSRYDEYERGLDRAIGDEYIRDYAPIVYRWVQHDEKDSIRWIIGQMEKVCDRYEIRHTLDAQMIADYLSEKKYHHFEHYTIGSSYGYTSEHTCLEVLKSAHHDMHRVFDQKIIALRYESYPLRHLYNNYEYALLESQVPYLWCTYLFMALGLTMLFLLFEFVNFIQFLISIPVAGVVMILTGIFIVLLEKHSFYYMSRWKIPVLFFTEATILLALAIAASCFRGFNKKIAGVLLNIGYGIAPFYLLLFTLMMDELTTYHIIDRCGNQSTEHTFWRFYQHPLPIFVFALVGTLCYLRLVKAWYAREE